MDQRLSLARSSSQTLNVVTDESAIEALAKGTDGRPYSIVFALQQSRKQVFEVSAMLTCFCRVILMKLGPEQRRLINKLEPMAEPLLSSIATFASAGLTSRESSIRRYAQYIVHAPDNGSTNSLLNAAMNRWSRFDIVAAGGLMSIPEPLLKPLLTDTDIARRELKQFCTNLQAWHALALGFIYVASS